MTQCDPNELKAIIDKITGLPTLPAVITKVTQLMQNPKVSASEVGQAISSDQALASKILKVVNSSFYGFPSRIKTITHAIVILGFNAVKATALSASVFSSFGKTDSNTIFDREGFWKHSIGVGAAAKIIAKRIQMKNIEEAFLCGLMHSIGKVILDEFLHEKFNETLQKVKEQNCLIVDAEREVLKGVTHLEIGAWLAHKWNLNQQFVYVIGNYHAPSSASDHFRLTSIVHIANILVRAMGCGNPGDNKLPIINEAAWKEVGINTQDLPELLEDIQDEVEKAEIFFNMAQD